MLELHPNVKSQRSNFRILEYNPFDPDTQSTVATVATGNDERWKIVRGPSSTMLELYTRTEKSKAREEVSTWQRQHFSIDACARRRVDSNEPWALLGLVAYGEPPREDMQAAESEVVGLRLEIHCQR